MTTQPHNSIPTILPPANCYTVLVIDDLQPNRILLSKFLKTAGYAVVEASNGIEALDLLMERAVIPDLIVTDVEMPVMDGITLVEQIRYLEAPLASVPIITASGNADDEMRNEAIRAGSDIFLTKPFDLAELRREMATLLRGRRQNPGLTRRIGGPVNRIESAAIPGHEITEG